MGYGDDIMATGLARGFKAMGKRAAFGDGRKIVWGPWSEEMFRHNPNVAKPGSEGAGDLEWVPHYKGSRMYNKLVNGKWVWNYDFKARPGELFFTDVERQSVSHLPEKKFILVEPNVPWQKVVAPNKDWGEGKYSEVARALRLMGHALVQFEHVNTRRRIKEAMILKPHNFRQVLAALARASLYIGPEGGLHHGAAAVGTNAVVLFGGFIPPEVVGYDGQICLTGGVKACGNINPCGHCRDAMSKITVDEVVDRATELLS
jgi:hypothetical protein